VEGADHNVYAVPGFSVVEPVGDESGDESAECGEEEEGPSEMEYGCAAEDGVFADAVFGSGFDRQFKDCGCDADDESGDGAHGEATPPPSGRFRNAHIGDEFVEVGDGHGGMVCEWSAGMGKRVRSDERRLFRSKAAVCGWDLWGVCELAC